MELVTQYQKLLINPQESEFLKSALTLPWTLSTSQQPQQQMAGTHFSVTEPELTHLVR